MENFKLEQLPLINPIDAKKLVPKQKGIYFWINKKTKAPVYIGVALGKNGLYHRIVKQHLNTTYLEYRPERQNSKDNFQLQYAVERINKKGILEYGIDQSSFRKNIGRTLKIKPGTATVAYILENLELRYLINHNIAATKKQEKELIMLYAPIFNNSHKRVTTSNR